jgi:death-on-curing family protein
MKASATFQPARLSQARPDGPLYARTQEVVELAKPVIHHVDFDTLVLINREVVSLTSERHEYTDEDAKRIRALLKEVREAGSRNDFEAAVLEKASVLIFRIASGQHFHEGNKRTALVAGLAFLEMNGHTLDIKDPGLVSVVDRAGISTATLNDVSTTLKRLVRSV